MHDDIATADRHEQRFDALFAQVLNVIVHRQQSRLVEALARLHQSIASYRAGLSGSDALVSVTLDQLCAAARNIVDLRDPAGESPHRTKLENSLLMLGQLFEESHLAAISDPLASPLGFMPGYELALVRISREVDALAGPVRRPGAGVDAPASVSSDPAIQSAAAPAAGMADSDRGQASEPGAPQAATAVARALKTEPPDEQRHRI